MSKPYGPEEAVSNVKKASNIFLRFRVEDLFCHP